MAAGYHGLMMVIMTTTMTRVSLSKGPLDHPRDCLELKEKFGEDCDGVYSVWLADKLGSKVGSTCTEQEVKVYCNMTTDGGGWMVFQRREIDENTPATDFYLDWDAYRNGFGYFRGEFWLGNENLHQLTAGRRHTLRIELGDFEGNTSYATYDDFKIGSENDNYTLSSVGSYDGTAGDSLSRHVGRKFSTADADNDDWENCNCALKHQAAWWYHNCSESNLNGQSHGVKTGEFSSHIAGIEWQAWRGFDYSLKTSAMMVKPVVSDTDQ